MEVRGSMVDLLKRRTGSRYYDTWAIISINKIAAGSEEDRIASGGKNYRREFEQPFKWIG